MASILQYEQGELIKSADHNVTQRNGVIFSKPIHSTENEGSGTVSVYTLSDFTMEQSMFEGLKLKLLIDTDSSGDSFYIKINSVNYSVSGNVKSGNVYNLVSIEEAGVFKFQIEKSGGGLDTVTTLWSGTQPYMNGDYVDLTISNVLTGITGGLLVIKNDFSNYPLNYIVPVASLISGYDMQLCYFFGQSGAFVLIFNIIRQNDDLIFSSSTYTTMPYPADILEIQLIQ